MTLFLSFSFGNRWRKRHCCLLYPFFSSVYSFLHSFKMIGLEETSLTTSVIIISISYSCGKEHFFEQRHSPKFLTLHGIAVVRSRSPNHCHHVYQLYQPPNRDFSGKTVHLYDSAYQGLSYILLIIQFISTMSGEGCG